MWEKEVFDIDPGQRVGCYHCMKQGCQDSYGFGKAFLAGPDHSPYDGNANFICAEHLDDDAKLPDGYPSDYIAAAKGHVRPNQELSGPKGRA